VILDFTEKKIKNYVMIDVMGDGMSPAEKNCARPRARTSYIVHRTSYISTYICEL